MATVPLPPIQREGHMSTSQHSFSSRSKQSSANLAPLPRKPVLRSKREDKTYLKMEALRKQLPILTKQETDRITYSFKNNLCLDMLSEGLHEAFTEIFNIMKKQHEVREDAGPESTLWTKKLLDDEPEKLTTMKDWLIRAEKASLEDDFITVYHCHHELAKYFQTTSNDDKWISDHFFDLALNVTEKLDDGGRLIAEANCNTGLALKEAGNFLKACEHFEIFYTHSSQHSDWTKENGVPLVDEACRQLSSIYMSIAEKHYSTVDRNVELEEERDSEIFHDYLVKSYDKACEAGDIYLEGLSSYKLGVAYFESNQHETAIKYLNIYKDACLATKDMNGLGTAYRALAKALQSIGKEDDSIRHLEMYAQVSEESKNDNSLSQACSNLGQVFNTLGEYDQAVDNFNKSYNISRAINDDSAISISRVFYGIATAHKMNNSFLTHLTEVDVLNDDKTKQMMGSLMDWKDSRTEDIIRSETEQTNKYEQDTITSSMAELFTRDENEVNWSDEDK